MANPSEDARYGKRIDLSEKATNSLTLQDLKSKKNDTVELLAEAFNGSKLSKHSIKILNCLDTLKGDTSISRLIESRTHGQAPKDTVQWITWALTHIDQLKGSIENDKQMIGVNTTKQQTNDLKTYIQQINDDDIKHLRSLGQCLIHYRHILFAERDPQAALAVLLLNLENHDQSVVQDITLFWALNAVAFYEDEVKNLALMHKTLQLGKAIHAIATYDIGDRQEQAKQRINEFYKKLLPYHLSNYNLSHRTIRWIILLQEFGIVTPKELNQIDPDQLSDTETEDQPKDNTTNSLETIINTLSIFCCCPQHSQGINSGRHDDYFTHLPKLLEAMRKFHQREGNDILPSDMLRFMKWLHDCASLQREGNQTPLPLCGLAMKFEAAINNTGIEDDNTTFCRAFNLDQILQHSASGAIFELNKCGNFANWMPTEDFQNELLLANGHQPISKRTSTHI